jgi:hypothetical protein
MVGYQYWSKDGRYIYFAGYPDDPSVFRVRLSDHYLERVASLTNLQPTGLAGFWMGRAPDDSPLLLRNAGSQEVYALDWEAP